MIQKTKKTISVLLSLLMVLSVFGGMSLTAYATSTETLLTTITATGTEQASYSTANVATVSFSNLPNNGSSYTAIWGWWGYGWTATVNAAEGYTITKCVFYDDKDRTATDSEAPFVVETTEEDKTPQVNGTPILAYTSKGITKIEVYGYATPAATHSVTITAGDHMTKTADSGEASQTDLTGAMTDVVYTADNGYYFPTNYSVAEVSGIKVTRDSYTQITVSGTPTADAAIALTAPTAKTTPDAPTTAAAENCTTADNNDGKLTGVTTAMEYKKSDAADWTAGTGNDIENLVPGTYYVRYKATDTANASANQELTIADYNTAAANTVSDTISALPAAADVTLDNAQAVADAKAAYDALTDDQKALVPADTVNKLNAAVAKIADLTAAEAVYDQAAFNDYKSDAVSAVTALSNDDDSDAAAQIIADAVAALNELSYDTSKSLDQNKAAVDAAADIADALAAQRATDALAQAKNMLNNALDVAENLVGILNSVGYTDIAAALTEAVNAANDALNDAEATADSLTAAREALQTATTDAYNAKAAADEAAVEDDTPSDSGERCPLCGKNHGDNKLARIMCMVMYIIKIVFTEILPRVMELVK